MKQIRTLEEIKAAFLAKKTVNVDSTLNFTQFSDGEIYGSCNSLDQCCEYWFKTVDEFFDQFKDDKIYELD